DRRRIGRGRGHREASPGQSDAKDERAVVGRAGENGANSGDCPSQILTLYLWMVTSSPALGVSLSTCVGRCFTWCVGSPKRNSICQGSTLPLSRTMSPYAKR